VSLVSTCYDGTVIQTEDLFEARHGNKPLPQKTAMMHRWAVRAHLYLTKTNRLPHAADWKETDRK
jgi:hypothetical protein